MSHYGGGGSSHRGYDDNRGNNNNNNNHYGRGGGNHRGYDDNRGRQQERYGSAGGYNNDRSRSRDSYGGRGGGERRGGGGDRYHQGGGRGFANQGGRGGRGGRAYCPCPQHPTKFNVVTNCWEVNLVPNPDALDWTMYHIEIFNARKMRTNPNAASSEPADYKLVPAGKPMDSKKAELYITRILNVCVAKKMVNIGTNFFAHDGKSIGYSARPLFTEEEKDNTNEGRVDSSGKSEQGRYGPADDGGHNSTMDRDDKPYKLFFTPYMNIYDDLQGEEEKEGEEQCRDTRKKKMFAVKLTEVGKIDPKAVVRFTENLGNLQMYRQALDIIMRSACLSKMLTYERSPRRFYFPNHIQDHIIQNFINNKNKCQIARQFGDKGSDIMPNIGITQAIRFAQSGGVFLTMDRCVNYFKKEKKLNHHQQQQQKIKVLEYDERQGKFLIAGYGVYRDQIPIRCPKIKEGVRRALKNQKMHVMYIKNKFPEDWEEKKRNMGWKQSRINKAKQVVRRNVIMVGDKERKKQGKEDVHIIWSARDTNQYSFDMTKKPRRSRNNNNNNEGGGEREQQNPEEQKEEVPEHTPNMVCVAEYFEEKYGIKLEYPDLPIIHIGKGEWYPLEFFSVAQDKAKGHNDPGAVLNYYDDHQGWAHSNHVQNLMSVRDKLTLFETLQMFSIRKNPEPKKFETTVLPEPTLMLGGREVTIENGSWKYHHKSFENPAQLHSFAVVDMYARSGGVGMAVEDYIKSLFGTMREHNMGVPVDMGSLQRVVSTIKEQVRNVAENTPAINVINGIDSAVQKARNFFLFDESVYFSHNKIFSRANVFVNGEIQECLIVPPPKQHRASNQVGLIKKRVSPTHWFNPNGGNQFQVRLMYEVLMNRDKVVVDPFNYRLENGTCNPQCLHENQWKPCQFGTFVYQDVKGNKYYDGEDGRCDLPIDFAHQNDIECPSMIFTYSPKEVKGAVYNLIKMHCVFQLGIASQNCDRSRFKNNFSAGIALKVNTKLYDRLTQARAWSCKFPDDAWIKQQKTMMVGMALAQGMGKEGETVAVASVALDDTTLNQSFSWRIMKKTHIVYPEVMKDMVNELIDAFVLHNGDQYPKRIVMYRHGVSDGNFTEALVNECGAIRTAVFERKNSDFKNKEPSVHNTVPITFIVCQSDHGVKIVPDRQPSQEHAPFKGNVPSGTLVDDTIIDQREKLQLPPAFLAYKDESPLVKDFFLVAHGGLKGTSRPMYYRVLLNENAVHGDPKHKPLDNKELQLLTYHQSFFYGSASKTVRSTPLVRYCTEYANKIIGYKQYLLDESLNLMKKKYLDNSTNDGMVVEDEGRYYVYERCDGNGERQIIRPHFPA